MTIITDGLPRDGIEELLESATAGLFRLAVGMDSETYRRHSLISGRQSSPVGGARTAIELSPLSDQEFGQALEIIDASFGASFTRGAQHTPEFRWPRTLRVIIATLPDKSAVPVSAEDRETRLMLPAVPGPTILELCGRTFTPDPMLKSDFQRLARAFLKDATDHAADPDWLAATWGLPSITPDVLEPALGDARVQRLQAQGFVSWIDTETFGPRVLVRVDELLAHYVAEEWSSGLLALREPDALTEEIDRLLRVCVVVPWGEATLAAAIFRATQRDPSVLSVAIPHLMEREPTTSRLTDGASVQLLVKGVPIRLHFGEGMDEQVVGNLQPWIVLSHLASRPLVVGDDEPTGNSLIFAKLGASPHFLYRPAPIELAHTRGLHVHEIRGIGVLPCLTTGIVEPLLQAMLYHAHARPDELVALSELAVVEKRLHLAWRTLTVAIAARNSTDGAVQRSAVAVEEALTKWWGKELKKALNHGVEL